MNEDMIGVEDNGTDGLKMSVGKLKDILPRFKDTDEVRLVLSTIEDEEENEEVSTSLEIHSKDSSVKDCSLTHKEFNPYNTY